MSDPRCGSPYGYIVHITNGTEKCEDCRRAHREAYQRHVVRRYLNRGPLLIDATGTRRRLQALAARGWSSDDLGARLGVTGAAVRQWTYRTRVQRDTAVKVADLYDELWDQPGCRTKTAARAAKRGWAVPLAWDDDEIDDPAALPRHGLRAEVRGRPRNEDREEQVMALTRAGLSATEIALRLRTNKRYVVRVRSRYRTEGAA